MFIEKAISDKIYVTSMGDFSLLFIYSLHPFSYFFPPDVNDIYYVCIRKLALLTAEISRFSLEAPS